MPQDERLLERYTEVKEDRRDLFLNLLELVEKYKKGESVSMIV